MAKELRCRDTGMNCDFVIRAESEGELMRKAAEHARKTHGMKELAPDMNAKVRAAIRNVQDQGMPQMSPQMSPAFSRKEGGAPQTPPGFGRKAPGEGTPQTPPGFPRKGGEGNPQTPPGFGRKGPGEGMPQTPPGKKGPGY